MHWRFLIYCQYIKCALLTTSCKPRNLSTMKMLYIFLACVALSSADDGISRIVGGVPSEIIPYQLGLSVNNEYKCGAVIISNEVALTTAQCVYRITPSTITVRAGSEFRSTLGTIHTVASVVVHPSYSTSTYDYDIAILRFTSNFALSATVGIIPLASAGETVAVASPAQVSGWGAIAVDSEALAGRVQLLTVPIVSNADCAAALSRINSITNRMICAGDYTGLNDFCAADAGGPLVYAGRLIGLASWGEKCGTINSPGVYTRISAVRDWISTEAGV